MVRTLVGIALVAALVGLFAVLVHARRRARAGGRPWSVGDTAGVASLVLAIATAAFGLLGRLPQDDPEPLTSKELYSLDGLTPERSAPRRDAVGFISLGDDKSVVEAELGTPARSIDGGFIPNSRTSEWRLPGGGEVSVTYTFEADSIVQFRVVVPPEGRARFALHRGLVLGSSSLRDFHRGWGRPAKFGTGRGRDYVAGYSSCFRGEEVFTKLDQSARRGRPYGAALDDEIVTSAYTFYDAQSEEKC